jgi:hypothetical protein
VTEPRWVHFCDGIEDVVLHFDRLSPVAEIVAAMR